MSRARVREKKLNTVVTTELSVKDRLDNMLQSAQKLSDYSTVYNYALKTFSENIIDLNFMKYVENTIEDKLYTESEFDRINTLMLLEIACNEIKDVEDFSSRKMRIENVKKYGSTRDVIVLYDDKVVGMYSLEGGRNGDYEKINPMKFVKKEYIDGIKQKYTKDKDAKVNQYSDYFVITEEKHIKVFVPKQDETSLAKVEETVIDKIRNRIAKFIDNNVLTKRKYLPELVLAYDSNPNRIKTIKTAKSKSAAKDRMKVLLDSERELTRTPAAN